MFVDLTSAYDNVWHCGFTCKLLQLLSDRHMVRMIMEMVSNRSFTHHWKQQKKQVTLPEERRSTGICPGSPSLQHLHL